VIGGRKPHDRLNRRSRRGLEERLLEAVDRSEPLAVVAPRRDDVISHRRGSRSLHRPARLFEVVDVDGDPGAVIERTTRLDVVDKFPVLAIEELEGGGWDPQDDPPASR
jgi:hypothetical protein